MQAQYATLLPKGKEQHMTAHNIEMTDAPVGLAEKAFPGLQEVQIDPADIGFVQALGFLDLKRTSGEDNVRLLGVYTGSQPFPEEELPAALTIPHSLDQLDSEYRTANRVGKGVLGRFWNNVRAARGWIDDPTARGVYAFDVNPHDIYFATRPFERGSSVQRITSHAAIQQQEKHGGLSEAYAAQRQEYRGHTALFMTEPPRPWVRRILRGAFPVPKVMGASFIAPLEVGAQATLAGITRQKR
jgi:hypothetical protein